jgi:hypothetical protein
MYAPENKLIVQCVIRSNFRRPHEVFGENVLFAIELNFDALFAIVTHCSIITMLNVTPFILFFIMITIEFFIMFDHSSYSKYLFKYIIL